jgi:hypothetical protein
MRGKLALACVVVAIGVFLVGGVALAGSFRGTGWAVRYLGHQEGGHHQGPGRQRPLLGWQRGREIYGNGGSDKINGNDGDDRIMVDDGNKDTVYCGSGMEDYVYADIKDTVYYGCETVKR